MNHFVDVKNIRALGGCGGNGAISFLSLWANENAGEITNKQNVMFILN